MPRRLFSDNSYWVTRNGSVITTNWRNAGKVRFVLPAIDKKGYSRVGLMVSGRLCTFKVHRLVATAYLPNPHNKPQVNHIDGNKSNNSIENLQWVTGSENMKHAIRSGLVKMCSPVNKVPKKGELNGCHKLTEKDVIKIRMEYQPRKVGRRDLANRYGVTESCIKDVVERRSWKHI